MVKVPSVKLNNGLEMPGFGLGTFLSKPNEVAEAVKYAIDTGYRYIDTAFFYGNEHEVGLAINEKISSGDVKREDIFLTTKLWCIHYDPSRVEYACRKSLENLGLDYIDLYLIHFPMGFAYVDDATPIPKAERATFVTTNDYDCVDIWKPMEQLVKKGLVRSIGISNFNADQTERILGNCEIKPVVNQFECHIELNQKKLREFCRKRDIVVISYCPLGRHNSAAKKPAFLYDERTKAIAKKYSKTPAQVAIRYCLELGTIPIPKSVTKSRIEENFQVFDFELSPDDMKILEELNTGVRVCNFSMVDKSHKHYPFKTEF
ncbi:unnamed protein product [Hermetia illucens]|uniref:NADP-dependent oxidoreductase domain-containing protein n=1 Tax=Hermetia illucens TaxID=343691 RepID=A0A7R8YRU8_HERIL|nr:1,5-anhydro-D-fructose reductase-like [Hermetia illucens]CAD7083088.1 unnamed protein product [Hermetia illucens]